MENKKEKKRLVLSETMILAIELLEDDCDKISLLRALIAYGKGEKVNTNDMYSNVEHAFKYLTSGDRENHIFTDDHYVFE